MSIEHSVLGFAENHVIHSFEYATVAAMEAAVGLTADDEYKLARITGAGGDQNKFYVLTDYSVPTWVLMSVPAGIVTLTGVENLTNKTLTSPVITTPVINGGDALGATSTEIDTTCDGPTAKNSHTHPLSDGATDITVSAGDLNSGSIAANLLLKGFFQRSHMVCVSGTVVKFGGGVYHHHGTENQLVHWDSEITYTIGPGGSNPDSDAPSGDGWLYFYLDNSVIKDTGVATITATEIVSNQDRPTWDHTKKGFYEGNDRCIGYCWLDGGSIQFFSFADDTYFFGDDDAAIIDGSLELWPTFSAVTCRSPFLMESSVYVNISMTATSGSSISPTAKETYFKINGSDKVFEINGTQKLINIYAPWQKLWLPCDDEGKLYLCASSSATYIHTVEAYQLGYKSPVGI